MFQLDILPKIHVNPKAELPFNRSHEDVALKLWEEIHKCANGEYIFS